MVSLKKITDILINLLFPPHCQFCSEVISWIPEKKFELCDECLKKVSFIGMDSCALCGKKLYDEKCQSCETNHEQRYYTSVISACEYEGLIREKLLDFKFNGEKILAEIFSQFLIEKLKMTEKNKYDIIISVPMHIVRQKERGYNQSELIAEKIAEHIGIPLMQNALTKNKPIERQSKLNKQQRNQNVKDVFVILNDLDIDGKTVLLIDDIITTGATVNECSKALIKAGAKEVFVATVAAGRLRI